MPHVKPPIEPLNKFIEGWRKKNLDPTFKQPDSICQKIINIFWPVLAVAVILIILQMEEVLKIVI